MNCRNRYVFVLFMGMAVAGASAQVSIDSCLLWARRNYPAVRQYELIERSEQYTLQNAARGWLPQVQLSAQATWQSDAASWSDDMQQLLSTMGVTFEGIRQDQYKMAVDISQPIYDGGRIAAQQQAARSQTRVDKLQADMELQAVEERVRSLFFGLLLLDRQQEQIMHRQELLQAIMERTTTLVRNDMARQHDADAVEAELIGCRQRQQQVASQQSAYRQMLQYLTGHRMEGDSLLMPAEPYVPLQNGDRVETQLLQAQEEGLEAQRRTLQASALPQVYAFAQGWYGYPGLNMFENMQNADWSWNAIVGLRATWNLSPLYTLRNRQRQIDVAQAVLRTRRETSDFNNRLQVTTAQSEVERLQALRADDQRLCQLRQAVRRAAETGWHQGVTTTTELLQKIADEADAATTYALHHTELLQALYQLQHLLGNN